MKRSLLLAATLAALGCAEIRELRKADANPYQNPFYAKYLNTGSSLDAQISRTLEGLRADDANPQLHNELGALLVQKGFPKDAEREFERAVDLDKQYYPAWYNLGMVRAARGDEGGSRRAFRATVHYKPGHAMALFQLGLIEEKLKHTDRAVELYAKALSINPALIQPSVNPRILDTKLVHRALIEMYAKDHARKSMQFQGVSSSATRRPPPAEAAPAPIVPPTAPPPTKKP
ncbi:MAG TPA: tetratricopeptide repeat protein [Thermoanaerobaculia bacterium]|jgi:tetratricopeptide (TPR) repeat protein|nr:tetratricopeptide repeat protein [Thermoanaerobaculia bacterium]